MGRDVHLRAVEDGDLPFFFEHQRDPEANRMAAFPARDREAFFVHWAKIRLNTDGLIRTIVEDGHVAGNVLSFSHGGEREVGYWLGREYYGRGIATRALRAFLDEETFRPLHAHVAKHNAASVRVLEKCEFAIVGVDPAFSTQDGQPIEGIVLRLD